jgi:peptidoglycan/LPS O-acetylase OafA/YrhL
VLYRPFVRARVEGVPGPELRRWALSRFLRIVPPYWVALTVTVIWLDQPEVFTPAGIPTFYGFAQTYAGKPLFGIPAAWYLCVLVAFYVFLVPFTLLMRRLPGADRDARLRGEALVLAGLASLSLAYKVLITKAGLEDNSEFALALPAFLDWFAIGMGLALVSVWLEGRPTPRPLRALDRFPGAFWVAALVVFWALCTQVGVDGVHFQPLPLGDYLVRHTLDGMVAAVLLLPVVLGDPQRGFLRRALRVPALVFLGTISYGVFLYHQAVLLQLKRWDLQSIDLHPYLLWPLAVFLGATLLALVSYYLIERPMGRLRGRLIRRLDARERGGSAAKSGGVEPAAAP